MSKQINKAKSKSKSKFFFLTHLIFSHIGSPKFCMTKSSKAWFTNPYCVWVWSVEKWNETKPRERERKKRIKLNWIWCQFSSNFFLFLVPSFSYHYYHHQWNCALQTYHFFLFWFWLLPSPFLVDNDDDFWWKLFSLFSLRKKKKNFQIANSNKKKRNSICGKRKEEKVKNLIKLEMVAKVLAIFSLFYF